MRTESIPSTAGKARAQVLSPQRRCEIARMGVQAREERRKLPKATHGSAEHPLVIGEIKIPCYVLENGTRVLSQRGIIEGLGMTRGGVGQLASFLSGKSISPFVNNEIAVWAKNPIQFALPQGGSPAYGYPATMLVDICEALLAARKAKALQKQQLHLADQAEILVRGFARVGIIALVDEATGYQKERARDALANILEAFVAKELQPWIKTFPSDYYEHLFRLRGLSYPPEQTNYRPRYFGKLTNDFIYKRLAPGVLEELKKQAIKDEKRGKLHQRLTMDYGHPKLREHLASVITVMKLSKNFDQFRQKLNLVLPRYNETMSMDFDMD